MILKTPMSAESHSCPHVSSGAQPWLSSTRPQANPSEVVRGWQGFGVCVCVRAHVCTYNSPSSASRHPSARHGNRASGFLFQPRVSHACSFLGAASRVFLFC